MWTIVNLPQFDGHVEKDYTMSLKAESSKLPPTLTSYTQAMEVKKLR